MINWIGLIGGGVILASAYIGGMTTALYSRDAVYWQRAGFITIACLFGALFGFIAVCVP